jgi:hypothetical protein
MGASLPASFRDGPKGQARNPYPQAVIMDSGLDAYASLRNDEGHVESVRP